MAKTILVVAEHEGGKLRRGAFEALALARQLAPALDARPVAVVLGSGVGDMAAELAARGADEAIAIDDPLLAQYTPDGYRIPLAALVAELKPEWVLMSHSYLAQDVLPLVAAAFEAPVISDSVGASVEDGRVIFQRQPYDAKFVARTVDNGPAPRFATVQSGAVPADELPAGHGGTVASRAAGVSADQVRRGGVEVRESSGKTIDLSSAEVIVAGGRGLGDKEKFEHLVGGLAKAVGGAIAAWARSSTWSASAGRRSSSRSTRTRTRRSSTSRPTGSSATSTNSSRR
ncbi:MAG: FAD-binding protein [Acidobacteria bacterium]|nr:FAD-binding protein [Acidobacteriota bacterium]